MFSPSMHFPSSKIQHVGRSMSLLVPGLGMYGAPRKMQMQNEPIVKSE